jgi:phytoene dehydrogenase-like protein
MTDVIVIGAGLNGLVAGALLAKQKLSVIVLDQCPTVGGAAITTEIAPGYRAPTLSHAIGPISREVVRALRLNISRAGPGIPDARSGIDHAD